MIIILIHLKELSREIFKKLWYDFNWEQNNSNIVADYYDVLNREGNWINFQLPFFFAYF